MRDDQLPSPGLINNGRRLRMEMAQAVSYLQVNARPDGTHTEAAVLNAFLDAAKAAIVTIIEPVIP